MTIQEILNEKISVPLCMLVKGKPVTARYWDENYSKIPPSLSEVIKNTVRDYYDKYYDSDYLNDEERRNLKRWINICHNDDIINDELC